MTQGPIRSYVLVGMLVLSAVLLLIPDNLFAGDTRSEESDDVCDSDSDCHDEPYDLWMRIGDLSAPAALGVGETGEVAVQLDVIANSNWRLFADHYICTLTVECTSDDDLVSVSGSPVLVEDVQPGFSREFTFAISGEAVGEDYVNVMFTLAMDNHEEGSVEETVFEGVEVVDTDGSVSDGEDGDDGDGGDANGGDADEGDDGSSIDGADGGGDGSGDGDTYQVEPDDGDDGGSTPGFEGQLLVMAMMALLVVTWVWGRRAGGLRKR